MAERSANGDGTGEHYPFKQSDWARVSRRDLINLAERLEEEDAE